jgi:phage regulator Rha-like protein
MELEEMYLSGMSTREIAEKIGRTHTWVIRHLKEKGIPRRDKHAASEKQRQKAYRTCVVCGTVFYSRYKKLTCSSECLKKYRITKYSNENAANWRGGKSQTYYQRIRRTLKMQVCEMCGKTEGRLDTHHKDRDRGNNSATNIMVLCVNCHAYLHYIEDDRGLRGWKPKE